MKKKLRLTDLTLSELNRAERSKIKGGSCSGCGSCSKCLGDATSGDNSARTNAYNSY